jgi:hypothetical protein
MKPYALALFYLLAYGVPFLYVVKMAMKVS